jgi:hypothetical protein
MAPADAQLSWNSKLRRRAMDAVARLSAIEEIKLLKARYFRGVDTKDWDLLSAVLAPDVTCDYRGSATDPATGINHAPEATAGALSGRGVVLESVRRSLEGVVSAHQGYLPEIEILDANTATGIWAMFDVLRFPPGHPLRELYGYGHYYERYVRTEGHWRIQSLRLERLRVETTPA